MVSKIKLQNDSMTSLWTQICASIPWNGLGILLMASSSCTTETLKLIADQV